MSNRFFSISIRATAILLLIAAFLLGIQNGGAAGLVAGCASRRNYSEVEQDDWVFCYSYGKLYVKDLSESGKQKTVLVLPAEFNGQEVRGVDDKIESEKLEVLYVTHNTVYSNYECPNLSKVVLVSWEGDPINLGRVESNNYKICVRNSSPARRIQHKIKDRIYFANTNFYYNYENSPKQGVYWIDNFNWGGKVDYIPQNPTREGYNFTGWYLEPECINKLDDNYSLPNEQLDESGEVLYQEVALYAKWNKV